MALPVSVVVPHQKSRSDFFQRYSLPSIRMNDPSEIFIEDWEGGACEKRNAGAAKSTQPYILFVDDDTILSSDCIPKMLALLESRPDIGYVYSDYVGFSWPGVSPGAPNYLAHSLPFNEWRLTQSNYIDTTSLLRRSVFPGFDPAICRLQDWDLWLTLLGNGVRGTYIPDTLFFKFTIDQGISATVPLEESCLAIKRKHKLT
jgi:glycosyltransferase involved in cell wall biosynthesis